MKIKGIKKSVGQYKEWINRDFGHVAYIMMDTETGEVWTDCFVSCNEWKEYASESVISLTNWLAYYEMPVNMGNVKNVISKLIRKGIIPPKFRV